MNEHSGRAKRDDLTVSNRRQRCFVSVSLCWRLVLLFCFIGFELWAEELPSEQGQEQSDKTIRQVIVEGNEVVSDGLILGKVRSRAGSVFSKKLVSEDARRLILMLEIYDVKWREETVDSGVDVIFEVKETPRIEKVSVVDSATSRNVCVLPKTFSHWTFTLLSTARPGH